MSKETAISKVPTWDELCKAIESNDEINLFKLDAMQVILNRQPKKEWVLEHPIAKVKGDNNKDVAAKYLPVDKVVFLLRAIFKRIRIEVKEKSLIANSISVTVRLHYFNPVLNEWEWQDGVGAAALQTDKDAGATDFNRIKSSAVQMALPAAETYAIKDAAQHIGRLFGGDLNHREIVSYETIMTKYNPKSDRTDNIKDIKESLELMNDKEELKSYHNKLVKAGLVTPEVTSLFTEINSQLNK